MERHFEKFGKCYVTIKRADTDKPYAFVEYRSANDGEKAVSKSKDLRIGSMTLSVVFA